MRRLRIGVIGTGTIAYGSHLPAIAQLRDELELVAVADVREDVVQHVAQRFGAQSWYTDYHDLLARPDIDLVDVCTPEFLHREQVVAAAQAGKHIHCEKPMASSVEEADAMIAAARAAGVKLMIGHSRRFTRRYQLIREAIERGEVGEVRLVRENERRAYPRTPRPDSVGHWNPEGDRSWLAKAGYTLGAALTNAVHETDLARWFAGQDAASVYAAEHINDPESEVPDFITYTITFRNGAVGACEVVNTLPVGYPYYHMMEVFGTEGMIRATDPSMSTLEVWTAGQMAFPLNPRTFLGVADAYVQELAGFARAVREDTPVPLDPWNGRQALAISVAAVESSRTGRPVSLPEEVAPITA